MREGKVGVHVIKEKGGYGSACEGGTGDGRRKGKGERGEGAVTHSGDGALPNRSITVFKRSLRYKGMDSELG